MESPLDGKVLASIATTADAIESSRSQVKRLVKTGVLESVKVGRSRRIVVASIRRMVAGKVVPAPVPAPPPGPRRRGRPRKTPIATATPAAPPT